MKVSENFVMGLVTLFVVAYLAFQLGHKYGALY
jgi:hypothetical protein